MEKKLSDYLHLYLGCEVRIFPLDGDEYLDTIEAIVVGESVNFKKSGDYYFDDANEFLISLVLRPLSSMTEEEENEVAKICFGSEDFIITSRGMGYNCDGNEIHESVRCIKIETFCEHPKINNWLPAALLQIDMEDDFCPIILGRFSDQGKVLKDDMIESPFELTRYLLSKHFDLFDLISSGLAIDKTKHPSP